MNSNISYINSDELTQVATSIKTKSASIIDTFNGDCVNAIKASDAALQISGYSSEKMISSLTKIFDNLNARTENLSNFIIKNVSDEYYYTSKYITNSFDREMGTALAKLLGITQAPLIVASVTANQMGYNSDSSFGGSGGGAPTTKPTGDGASTTETTGGEASEKLAEQKLYDRVYNEYVEEHMEKYGTTEGATDFAKEVVSEYSKLIEDPDAIRKAAYGSYSTIEEGIEDLAIKAVTESCTKPAALTLEQERQTGAIPTGYSTAKQLGASDTVQQQAKATAAGLYEKTGTNNAANIAIGTVIEKEVIPGNKTYGDLYNSAKQSGNTTLANQVYDIARKQGNYTTQIAKDVRNTYGSDSTALVHDSAVKAGNVYNNAVVAATKPTVVTTSKSYQTTMQNFAAAMKAGSAATKAAKTAKTTR